MEAVLTGTIIEDPPIVTPSYTETIARVLESINGHPTEPDEIALGYNSLSREHGWDWPSRAFTMVGRKRLHNFRTLIETVLREGVPGDIVETGVWRGGASILARAVLMAHDITDRRVIVADSFEGLPPPNPVDFPADAGSPLHEIPALAVSLEQVAANFGKFDLLDRQVVFVKGWFRDTMPTLPTAQVAVLRLDGDMYESTIDPLTHLWDKIPAGGWVIVDDYHIVPACKEAVHDFLSSRRLAPSIQEIDSMGVFFRKF